MSSRTDWRPANELIVGDWIRYNWEWIEITNYEIKNETVYMEFKVQGKDLSLCIGLRRPFECLPR